MEPCRARGHSRGHDLLIRVESSRAMITE